MIWDVAIAIGAAVCQFMTAWLGWRITTNPLDPQDPKQGRKRTQYHIAFVTAGVLGIFFIGLAAYRMPRDRAHLQFKVGPTYQNTDVPMGSWSSGTGEHRAEFLQVDQPLAFNIAYTNVGPGVAVNIEPHRGIFIEPGHSPLTESDALAQFEKAKAITPARGIITQVKGDSAFVTAEGPVLSPEDYNNLVYGRRVVYVVAELAYHDDSGTHVRQYCQFLQPPATGGILIWAYCDNFNGEF